MREYLEKLPLEIKELILIIRDLASELNCNVYLVGGFVRDLLLGVKNLDLDIVVEGDGLGFAEKLSRKLEVRVVFHRRFGTATCFIRPHLKLDIATCRREFYPKPGHLPVVSFGLLKDDLFRRDFTINAMAISISNASFGRFIDLFNGKSDLANKKIRVLHNLSFVDDPTRILRAVRFEQRYGFRLEAATLFLLKEASRQGRLEKIQPQRVRDEIILILKEKNPIKALKRLGELSGLGFINRDLSLSRKRLSLLKESRLEIKRFNRLFPNHRRLDNWVIYLMALLDGQKVPEIKKVLEKFVFAGGIEKRVLTYIKSGDKVSRVINKPRIKLSRVYNLLEPLSYEVIILIRSKSLRLYARKEIDKFFKLSGCVRLHISGHDLNALGIKSGPRYQEILRKVLNARIENRVNTKDEELVLARKLAKIK
ncbi:MAG: hypothetical protein ABIH27_06395 [Candidatus Omnitrophota bacterium]